MPDIADRDEKEAQYARLMAKLLKAYGGRLLEKLGDPPNLANLPSDFWDEEAKELAKALSPFGEKVYLDAARQLMKQAPIEVDWDVVNENAARWARQHTGDWLAPKINETNRNTIQAEIDRLRVAIPEFFERPMTRGDLEQRLQENGLFGPVRAEMIAVTEVTRAASQGEQQVAKILDDHGITMIPIWQTNEDELVCPLCEPKNDKPQAEWPTPDFPPEHVRCRCWINYTFPEEVEAKPEEEIARADWEKPVEYYRDISNKVFEIYGYEKATGEHEAIFQKSIDELDPYIKQLWKGDNTALILANNPEWQYWGTHQSNWIVLGQDSWDGAIAQHEFIHHIIGQGYIQENIFNYDPVKFFHHAEQPSYDRHQKYNEDITCLLSAYNTDKIAWAKEIAGEGEGLNYDEAIQKIESFEKFRDFLEGLNK